MIEYIGLFFAIGSLIFAILLALYTYFEWRRRKWKQIEHERRIQVGWNQFLKALLQQQENEKSDEHRS